MADTIRLAEYFYVETSDRAGEGARILEHLRGAGVNLTALHAFPAGRKTQVDFVPASATEFKAAARAAKWKVVGPKKALIIEGEDRVGALADYFRRLGEAKINVTASTAIIAGAGRFGAILWVKSKDVRRAATVLGAR
jgi:hypothetical protein